MSPQEALELINANEHTGYVLGSPYSGGEGQGAFRASDTNGHGAVVKISRNPQWAKQVARGKAATDHLRTLGYAAPTYTTVGATDSGSYWLQNELPGAPVSGAPTAAQISSLMHLIELQKDQAISEVQGQDWVWYITDVVFRGTDGNVRTLMQFSPQTSKVLYEAVTMVSGLQTKALPKTDLVHGAMSLENVLFNGDEVTGVLNWDQAGYGDRAIDLVGLWYSLINFIEARDGVMAHLLEISDRDAVKIYVVDRILAQISWHINKVHGDVDLQVARATTAIELLKQL